MTEANWLTIGEVRGDGTGEDGRGTCGGPRAVSGVRRPLGDANLTGVDAGLGRKKTFPREEIDPIVAFSSARSDRPPYPLATESRYIFERLEPNGDVGAPYIVAISRICSISSDERLSVGERGERGEIKGPCDLSIITVGMRRGAVKAGDGVAIGTGI